MNAVVFHLFVTSTIMIFWCIAMIGVGIVELLWSSLTRREDAELIADRGVRRVCRWSIGCAACIALSLLSGTLWAGMSAYHAIFS